LTLARAASTARRTRQMPTRRVRTPWLAVSMTARPAVEGALAYNRKRVIKLLGARQLLNAMWV
jgi:hypothetical protein